MRCNSCILAVQKRTTESLTDQQSSAVVLCYLSIDPRGLCSLTVRPPSALVLDALCMNEWGELNGTKPSNCAEPTRHGDFRSELVVLGSKSCKFLHVPDRLLFGLWTAVLKIKKKG